MKCTNCGFANGWDDRFCSKCGAALPGPEGAESEQAIHNPPTATAIAVKPKPILKILVIGISILALAVIAVLLVVLLGDKPSADSGQLENALIFLNNDQENIFLTFDGDKIEDAEFENIYRYAFSYDRSVCAVVAGEEEKCSYDEPGTLYIVSADGVVEVAEDVLGCAISDNGKSIAYVSEADAEDLVGELYLFDVTAGTREKIASDVYAYHYYILLSPDGKSVGYIGDYEPSWSAGVSFYPDDEFTGYVYVDGETLRLGDRCLPVAVSNNAEFIYYQKLRDSGDRFYVKYDDNQEKLAEGNYSVEVFFNQDMSEVLYTITSYSDDISESTEASFLWAPGAGVTEISDGYVYAVSPPGYRTANVHYVDSVFMNKLTMSTYKNTLIISYAEDWTNGEMFEVGPDYNLTKITDSGGGGSIGKTVLYYERSDNSDWIYSYYVIDNYDKSEKSRLLVESISALSASRSYSDIYYIKDNVLYHTDLTGKSRKVADDVVSIEISPYDTLYYLTGEGELFGIDGDAAPVKIAEQVGDLNDYCNGVYYTTDTGEGLDVYISTSGVTFVKILSGIDSIEMPSRFGFVYMK